MATETAHQPRELFHTKGCHVYLIRYLPGQEEHAAEQVYRWVNDPDLDFDWRDCHQMTAELDVEQYIDADELALWREPVANYSPWPHWFYLSAGTIGWLAFAAYLLSVIRGMRS